MAYVPVTFVDGVTPLNAANLNNLEDGIEELFERSGSTATGEWSFVASPVEPPGSGQLRLNQAVQSAATKLWVHNITAPGVDAHTWLLQVKSGDDVYIQDKDDASRWQLFTASADAIDRTTYVEIPVTWVKGGTALAEQRVMFTHIRAGGGGGGGGADLSYDGDWVAGTYQDGDVVVKDGVAYICVGGPTTVAPDPAPWGAAALAKVAYGTTLPVSPVDGQEAILVDSLTAPTYQWRFRYNAGSTSAYKWEFIGGSARYQKIDTDETGSGVGPGDLATVGPQMTLPRAGDYACRFGTEGYIGGGAFSLFLYLRRAAVTVMNPLQAVPVADVPVVLAAEAVASGAAASEVIKLQYGANGGTPHFRKRWLAVTPVRVA